MQGGQCAGCEELVGESDRDDALALAGVGEGGGDRFGEPADDGVVLEGDDETVGAGGGQDGRGVERLDGRYMQDGDVDVVGLEAGGRLQGAHGHQAGGDEYDVAPGAQLGGLAELEAVVVLVEHAGDLAAQQAHVGRARGRGQRGDGLLDVDGVARVDDGEVRGSRGGWRRPRWPGGWVRSRWSVRAGRPRC